MNRYLWGAFLAGMAALGVLYLAQSSADGLAIVWTAVAWSAVVATVAGIRMNRPSRPGPWWLTAAGLTATAVAGTVAPVALNLPPDGVRASVGNVLYVGSYLMIGAAVLWFVRLQTCGGDRDSVIDGVIVTIALASVLWTVVIDPSAVHADATLMGRIVYIVAPILPAGITAVCVRLLFAASGRLASARLLGGAWILAFVGSVGWVVTLQADTFVAGGWPDMAWVAALGCAGASALHPSMADMSTPTVNLPGTASAGRLTVLGLALLATPVGLLLGTGQSDANVIAPITAAGLIALLILGRFAGLVREREQARDHLELHALRQEVVARIGRAALSHRPMVELYDEAADLIAGAIADGVATIRVGATPPSSASGRPLHSLPITNGEQTRATLDVLIEPPRTLTPGELLFLTSSTAMLSAMTARHHAEDDLRRRAMHDELTGLANRVLLTEHLRKAISIHPVGTVGVLFVDLDGFKAVNDDHGHGAGDALLRELADRMAHVVRSADLLGRLAGDEFVIVAAPCGQAALSSLAARVLEVLTAPFDIGSSTVAVTASIGSVLAAQGETEADVLRRADAAMYDAKANGGRRVSVNTERAPLRVV